MIVYITIIDSGHSTIYDIAILGHNRVKHEQFYIAQVDFDYLDKPISES